MLPCSHAENEARFHFSVTNCPGTVLAGLSWRRDPAELVQEAHDIPLVPVFKELPSRRVGPGDARHRHLPASPGDRARCPPSTGVGGTNRPPTAITALPLP